MKLKYPLASWLIVLVSLAFLGCEANRYEIEMKPDGEKVQRELTVWRERNVDKKTELIVFPVDELSKIAEEYHSAIPNKKREKHKFVGNFTGAMPSDIGGSGSYTHWATPFGSVSAYLERFRGNDDLLANIDQRGEAVDRLVDLMIDWLESELDGEAGFDKLRTFMDDHFRRDLKNISLYAWASEIKCEDQETFNIVESPARVTQYLIERSYFTLDELPEVVRALQETEQDSGARFLSLIQRFAASKMGIAQDQPIPPYLQFLSEQAALEDSIKAYLRKTDEFKELLEEWEEEKIVDPDTKEPQPGAVIGDLIAQAFFPNFRLGPRDYVKVKLGPISQPMLTNGEWNEKTDQVQWSCRMLEAGSKLSEYPSLLYAIWSVPDEQEQRVRFGKVVLEGDSLAYYCLWYRGLSAQEAKEWDSFVASLIPNDNLVGRIRSFRFSHEPPRKSDNENTDLAAPSRELLLRSLTGDSKAK